MCIGIRVSDALLHSQAYPLTPPSGKDQMKPLNAIHKSRNCHVSLSVFALTSLT